MHCSQNSLPHYLGLFKINIQHCNIMHMTKTKEKHKRSSLNTYTHIFWVKNTDKFNFVCFIGTAEEGALAVRPS